MSDNLKAGRQLADALNAAMRERDEKIVELEARLASQQAAHDAEIERLKEENRAWKSKWEALKLKHDLILPVAKGLEEQLSAANAACAMKDEALRTFERNYLRYDFNCGLYYSAHVKPAISASPQQVSEWERKQIEPLRAQVAAWVTMVESLLEEFGDENWQEVIQQAKQMLADNKATAEQFIAECEQRGAVKALEKAVNELKIRGVRGFSLVYLDRQITEMLETSKKAG